MANNDPRVRGQLTHLEVAPYESIYVGVAPSDIIASREVGVPVAVVSTAWAETSDQEKLFSMPPDMLFTSVEEFKEYIYQVCIAQRKV